MVASNLSYGPAINKESLHRHYISCSVKEKDEPTEESSQSSAVCEGVHASEETDSFVLGVQGNIGFGF